MKFLFFLLLALPFFAPQYVPKGNAAKYFGSKSFQTPPAPKPPSDTLTIPYTYWWPSGGPFIGLCGWNYSMVVTGTITQMEEPSKFNKSNFGYHSLYTPQKAVIKIDAVKYVTGPEAGPKKQPGKKYANEKYITSDCFYESGLKKGDKVLVFIYSYEGEYSIPGGSVLKIKSFKDPAVLSIEKYIKNNQDPLSIKADTLIWKKHGLDYALKGIIECRESK